MIAGDFEFTSVDEERSWRQEGLALAYDLQNELPDIEISYVGDTDPRPVRMPMTGPLA
jgi:hypothetical protein